MINKKLEKTKVIFKINEASYKTNKKFSKAQYPIKLNDK